jgi:hypothetical protein
MRIRWKDAKTPVRCGMGVDLAKLKLCSLTARQARCEPTFAGGSYVYISSIASGIKCRWVG